jgi:hypothetical protein
VTPDLSVLLVVGERRDRAEHALASVLAQSAIDRMEVLLFDCAPGDPLPLPGSGHPAVRVRRLPPDILFSAAKVLGVRTATAPVIVFLEEHCRAQAGWAEALIEAHRGPWAGIGAEVHNGNPGEAVSRTVALMNYHPWLPPAARAEHRMLPGHNSSFKRDVLLSYGDRLDDLMRAEIVLHLRLHLDGHRLLLEPAARFEHINESNLPSIVRGYFLWHRCYGPMRARAFGWSRARRLLYIVTAPAIPVYFLLRLALVLSRNRPELLGRALAATPRILVAQLASAAGQAFGLAFGIGDAEARFSLFEMNEPR